jgi:hypothetical protein
MSLNIILILLYYMYVTINMCILKNKIQALTLVGIMTEDECNILHVKPKGEWFKPKHVVLYNIHYVLLATQANKRTSFLY